MKILTEPEARQLENLLKRAIANGQFNLNVASPYADDQWKRDGWDWNDRHDGHSVNSNDWHSEMAIASGEDPETDVEYTRPEVTVYVDNRSLRYLAGNEPQGV